MQITNCKNAKIYYFNKLFMSLFPYLDLLSQDGLSIHGVHGGVGVLLPVEGDESVPLAGVVNVAHHTELLELSLKRKKHIKIITNTGKTFKKKN